MIFCANLIKYKQSKQSVLTVKRCGPILRPATNLTGESDFNLFIISEYNDK